VAWSPDVAMSSRTPVSLAIGLALLASGPPVAHAGEPTTVGGGDGEIDLDVGFVAALGNREPYQRSETWQTADIQAIHGGVGYSVGNLGPLADFYLRLEGGYYNSAEEQVERAEDDLPVGYQFYGRDRGGWLTAVFGASFVHEPRFRFGAFVRGTVPVDVELAKFSNIHFHYAVGGIDARIWITDPDWLLRLGFASRSWLGSGAYLDAGQHNAAVVFENLLVFEAARWALPWRAGISFGPIIEADLNSHVNRAYDSAYAGVTPDLVAGDDVQSMRLDITVRPFVRITDNAAVELSFTQTLLGYDIEASQVLSAGLRTAF
jgi:hypothetical protein